MSRVTIFFHCSFEAFWNHLCPGKTHTLKWSGAPTSNFKNIYGLIEILFGVPCTLGQSVSISCVKTVSPKNNQQISTSTSTTRQSGRRPKTLLPWHKIDTPYFNGDPFLRAYMTNYGRGKRGQCPNRVVSSNIGASTPPLFWSRAVVGTVSKHKKKWPDMAPVSDPMHNIMIPYFAYLLPGFFMAGMARRSCKVYIRNSFCG